MCTASNVLLEYRTASTTASNENVVASTTASNVPCGNLWKTSRTRQDVGSEAQKYVSLYFACIHACIHACMHVSSSACGTTPGWAGATTRKKNALRATSFINSLLSSKYLTSNSAPIAPGNNVETSWSQGGRKTKTQASTLCMGARGTTRQTIQKSEVSCLGG